MQVRGAVHVYRVARQIIRRLSDEEADQMRRFLRRRHAAQGDFGADLFTALGQRPSAMSVSVQPGAMPKQPMPTGPSSIARD